MIKFLVFQHANVRLIERILIYNLVKKKYTLAHFKKKYLLLK